jgi:hypothetical protein
MRRMISWMLAAAGTLLAASCSSAEPETGAEDPPTNTRGDCSLDVHFRGTSYLALRDVDNMDDIRALVDLDESVGRAFAERCNGSVDRSVRLKVWAVRGVEPVIAIGYVVPKESDADGGSIFVNGSIEESDWPTFNATTGQLE